VGPAGADLTARNKQPDEKTYIRVHRLIGNSVPPVAMYHLGKTIRERVLDAARGL
jgi:hypothetical protein